ncbi:heat shock protein transcriptional repressor HspR [Aeromicrobium fastidiosum]|uniref:MerR family transcriptional regulator n=1 Tax=Aeromicrobium fastidiosum TaxID=52699 RepID=A0A641AQC7_9ACTN|nr:MerR family transcriptional regulator [Aeromicrobium fastidiosum]KAA1380145.1 MerR family transcriptional regulator [Aeromicrobium fastidiosum]MBP2389680.1 MerR family transcriptional regulator/heat shock protein HspR [Aeromicrobium fastidiosum]
MTTGPTGPDPSGGFQPPGPEAKVFVISVAAELSGLHPQTLRTYDRLGLVAPGRTGGGGRRYSLHDIELLRTVARLTAEGLGLEGVKRVIDLENQVLALQAKVAELQAELAQTQAQAGQVQNLPALIADNQVVIWRRMRR